MNISFCELRLVLTPYHDCTDTTEYRAINRDELERRRLDLPLRMGNIWTKWCRQRTDLKAVA